MSILDQDDNPRRLVTHDDDSDVSSCAYPYATVLDGIRWWVQRDRLSFPLHGVEDQSQPWGPCITPASGGEELHLYGTQVIKDLAVSTPHPWLQGHFEGTDRSFAMCAAFPRSDYYAQFDCRQGLGVSYGSPHCYSPPSLTSLAGSPVFTVEDSKQNAVGGVLLLAPSTLCGSPGTP
jgi:hypothetical protein